MLPSTWISYLEAGFRGSLNAGRTCLLPDGQRNTRSTKFGSAPVSNVETPGCREECCITTLMQTIK